LSFNTLLRGKFEGGEGLGTYLTPEEVVMPMVEMALATAGGSTIQGLCAREERLLFGDICGGTGRFVYALYRALGERGVERCSLERAATLFDQSSLAVGFARLNFLFEGMSPKHFSCVKDSLTEPEISEIRNSFSVLATNPPFGTGKYLWSQRLAASLDPQLLQTIGLRPGEGADPAELFVFRNLDLLRPGGVLAIVLPDGVLQSRDFVRALHVFEQIRETTIQVVAIVSLPTVTFSLGGTVAKTSFVILRRGAEREDVPVYLAKAGHVGFLKRGNRRIPDPAGNELHVIAAEFAERKNGVGIFGKPWHEVEKLAASDICLFKTSPGSRASVQLSAFARPVREFYDASNKNLKGHFHVSVLDVDETGLIDVISALKQRPVTRALSCQPGDVLISCINPRIWRATVVPDIKGTWSCSPEFVVLRPKDPNASWALSLAVHHGSVASAVQGMAGGTSSSRQRVEKDAILELRIPRPESFSVIALKHLSERTRHYEIRLREGELYGALHHCHEVEFYASATEHSPSVIASELYDSTAK
jgi:hypothetical protein